jgi:hypothetical protein
MLAQRAPAHAARVREPHNLPDVRLREPHRDESPKPLPFKIFHTRVLGSRRAALRLQPFQDMKSVLIADDDISVLALMARALPEYRITTARNGFESKPFRWAELREAVTSLIGEA